MLDLYNQEKIYPNQAKRTLCQLLQYKITVPNPDVNYKSFLRPGIYQLKIRQGPLEERP